MNGYHYAIGVMVEENGMIVYPMRKDIKSIVDFERLKKCNAICYKWCKHFKIKKIHYMRFIYSILKDANQYANKLTKKCRDKFIEDCKIMFYASEVEEILIKQYSAMVYNIMKRMRINYEKYDDFVTDGFMAIRSAVWQYRTYKIKASFTTYAHRAIFMRLRGKLHKEKLKNLLKGGFNVKCVSDFENKDFNLENCGINKDYSANTENIDLEIDNIVVGCGLTDQEAMILRSFVNRRLDVPMWYIDYRAKYINKQTSKPLSRQSVYNHLAVVHEKVLFYLQSKGITPNDYVPPKTRRGDFR